jgi:hypothetical protein
MIDAGAFRGILAALEPAEIAYMLTGSFASAFYGVTRATQDIDFVVDATSDQLTGFVQHLSGDQYYVDLDAALEALHHESMFNVVDMQSGWKIDLIIRKSRPFSLREFERRRRAEIQGTGFFVATIEDLMISKLEWAKLGSSRRQIADAAALLKLHDQTLDHAYIEKWISALELHGQWESARSEAGL